MNSALLDKVLFFVFRASKPGVLILKDVMSDVKDSQLETLASLGGHEAGDGMALSRGIMKTAHCRYSICCGELGTRSPTSCLHR